MRSKIQYMASWYCLYVSEKILRDQTHFSKQERNWKDAYHYSRKPGDRKWAVSSFSQQYQCCSSRETAIKRRHANLESIRRFSAGSAGKSINPSKQSSRCFWEREFFSRNDDVRSSQYPSTLMAESNIEAFEQLFSCVQCSAPIAADDTFASGTCDVISQDPSCRNQFSCEGFFNI